MIPCWVVSPVQTYKKTWERSVIHWCGVCQKHSDALVKKGRKLFRERKNDLEQFLGEYLCVPLNYVVLSFIVVFLSLWIMNLDIYEQRLVCYQWEL